MSLQKILVEPSQWGSARIVAGMRDSTAHWLGGSARIVAGPADRPDHLIISQESAVPPREMSRTNRPYLSGGRGRLGAGKVEIVWKQNA